MRPFASGCKDQLDKHVTSHQETLVPDVRPQAAQMAPDLAKIVDAWPELPEAIRAGILAVVKASRS